MSSPETPIIEPAGPYYRHSGTLTLLGAVISVAAVIIVPVVMAVLGGAFKLIGTYFVDVGFVGVVATGGLAGVLLGKIVKLSKIRNETAALWMGILAGVLLLLWTWFWFYIFLQAGDFAQPPGHSEGVYFPWEDPARTVRVIHTYATAEGERAMSALSLYAVAYLTKVFYVAVEFPRFSGSWLYALWIIEAVLAVLWVGVSCKATAGSHGFVFCEKCHREAGVLFQSPLLRPMPAEFSTAMIKLRDRLENGRFDVLEKLAVAGTIKRPGVYSRLILRGCPKCQNFFCADIAKVAVEWDSDDYRDADVREVDDPDNLVVEHLLLPAPWYERLRTHYQVPNNSTQHASEDEGGGWLVVAAVGGVMTLAMLAIVVFDL